MTTIYPFIPSNSSAFSFTPTLDGTVYNITVTWNLFGQRYYLNCYTLSGVLVFSLPLIGSPDDNWQVSAASWANNTATLTTGQAALYPHGSTLIVAIDGCVPNAYNGTYSALVLSDTQISYPLSGYPGPMTTFGTTGYDINLAAGYFNSTIVYDETNMWFEVSP